MPSKPLNWGLYTRMAAGFLLIAVGGPALTMYVTPTEEELFKRYNPELQKRSLENREQKQKDFDDFVTKLKEYSKSDKPIWLVQAEDEKRQKEKTLSAQNKIIMELEQRKDDMRTDGVKSVPGGSL